MARRRCRASPTTRPATGPEARPEAPAVFDRKPNRQSRPEAKPNPTAARVARERAKNPAATQEEIAKKVGVSERTVRNYWAAPAPTNVTPIHKEAAQ